MKTLLRATAAIVLSFIAATATAKSQTVMVEIVGDGLDAPLQLTDQPTLEHFSIWGSPGIDWSRGALSPPPRLQLYTVTFHQRGREPMHEWHRRYVVKYGIDLKTGRGYMYLPGPGDGEVYRRNTFSILREVEGRWFHASPEWEQTVRPLIDRRHAARTLD